MSGGSHGYIYSQIQDELCGQMYDAELNDLMKDIVELAHDLEWYDSSDISEESYKKTVTEFKKKWFKADRDDRLKSYIDKAVDKMRSDMYLLIGAKMDEEEENNHE